MKTKTDSDIEKKLEELRQEVNDLQLSQQLMNEKNERNRYVLQYLSDYIYTVKVENGEVVDTIHGSGSFPITGYTAEDYGKDPDLWYRMIHPEDRDSVTTQAEKALQGEEVPEIQHRIIHADGSVKWVRNTIVIRKNDSGKMLGYYGIINDITDLKKAEELAEIKNQQLIHADKMATIGILASGIAHEINNPNNFILLNTQIFKKIWEDTKPILDNYYKQNGDFVLGGMPYHESIGKMDNLVDGMNKGANRIQSIVKSLKEFSGVTQEKDLKEVHLNKILETAVLIAGNLIKNSTDNFNIHEEPDLPLIKGVPQRLEQVVINLISNACHSLTDKRQYITLRSGLNKEKNHVYILVEDQGIGIDEKDLQYIFDPFFTTKRDSGGTGLGLSISYNIVKNHGGDLIFESKPGEGTKATIILPVME